MLTSSLLFSISFVLLAVHSVSPLQTVAAQFSEEGAALQKELLQFAYQVGGSGAQEKLAAYYDFQSVDLIATVPDDHRGSGR